MAAALRQAGEIFEPQGLLPVPHTHPWLIGVANLRGGLYTVVDLGAFLGLRQARVGALPEHARLLAWPDGKRLPTPRSVGVEALRVQLLEELRR